MGVVILTSHLFWNEAELHAFTILFVSLDCLTMQKQITVIMSPDIYLRTSQILYQKQQTG